MPTINEDFDRRTAAFRTELLEHCYRMLGSVHDAEDLVQETMLRAWRAYDRYDESRASLRTWLFRIATNACLTALESRGRRPLPAGLTSPEYDPGQALVRGTGEVSWLQPIPDAMLSPGCADPAAMLSAQGSLRLAVVAAMQLLPARQRAVLILRDVLAFSAAEVAATLGTTPASVNSALQRARARLGEISPAEDQIDEPAESDRRLLVDRYVSAFLRADVAGITRLLTDQVVLEMPPYLNWFTGREPYGRFMDRVFATRGTDWRMLPLAANGQPAVAAYVRGRDGYEAHTLQVFTVTVAGVCRTTVFQDPEVFALFGLAPRLDVDSGAGTGAGASTGAGTSTGRASTGAEAAADTSAGAGTSAGASRALVIP